jgi:iron complex outermembrane receptor protein
MKFPVTSKLEINAQGRYDSYSRVHSDNVYSATQTDSNGLFVQLPSANLGNTFNSATGKLAFRYTPNRYIAFRGSIGTGFRAPALSDIAGAVVFNGSTSAPMPARSPVRRAASRAARSMTCCWAPTDRAAPTA